MQLRVTHQLHAGLAPLCSLSPAHAQHGARKRDCQFLGGEYWRKKVFRFEDVRARVAEEQMGAPQRDVWRQRKLYLKEKKRQHVSHSHACLLHELRLGFELGLGSGLGLE
jgi:hypothetical protein